jgi:two-component system chemotaxis sensor kinase CheA
VDTSSIPPAAHFDPEECYLSWKLSLMGDVTEEQISEIFEWVDGDCDLAINPITVENSEVIAAAQVETGTLESSAGMQAERQPATDRQADEAEPNQGERRAVAESSIRVNITKIDELINMVGELVITQSMLGQVGSELENVDSSKLEKLRNGLVQLERNTRELQESVMRIRMFPISFSFNRFPRMVHDLSSQLGKKVELKISGESTELDKTVMEKISDPLVHLVRNSLDHGIETPDVRVAKGKPETGIVHLNAYHKGGNIIIEVSDDGGGLPADRILAKARQRALVADDEREKILDLIFEPGFTTAEELSDVSGRGVGMDVVRRNIRDLGGSIEVTSEQDKGSKFTVRLPLTLAILDGQLLSVGSETFIMPLVSIVESLQLDCNLINTVAGQAEMYRLRDDYVPVVRLCKLFGIKPKSMNLQDGLLVVVEQDGMRIGLLVDELLGQQQVVIKSLETNFRRVEGLSGATILGDGTVALILDVGGLIAMSGRDPASGPPHKKEQAA